MIDVGVDPSAAWCHLRRATGSAVSRGLLGQKFFRADILLLQVIEALDLALGRVAAPQVTVAERM